MHEWTRTLLLFSLPLAAACGSRTGIDLDYGDLVDPGDSGHVDSVGEQLDSGSGPELQVDASDDAPGTTVATSSNVPTECIVPGGSLSSGTGSNLSCEEGCPALACALANGECPTANFTNCCVYQMNDMVWSNWSYDPAPSAMAYQMNFCESTGGAWYPATP